MRVVMAIGLISIAALLAACSDTPDVDETEIARLEAEFETAEQSPDVHAKWARSCALCHVKGEGGAPRMGDIGAWQPRIAKGRGVLLMHTLEGYNRMPPLGYCMDCETADFVAMINLMAGYQQ